MFLFFVFLTIAYQISVWIDDDKNSSFRVTTHRHKIPEVKDFYTLRVIGSERRFSATSFKRKFSFTRFRDYLEIKNNETVRLCWYWETDEEVIVNYGFEEFHGGFNIFKDGLYICTINF